jgi:O-antigen/teichoic acid export membrane protein
MAIIDTARPVVLESKKQSCEDFKKNVSRTYAMTTWLALAQSVIFTLFAGLIIRILYGEAYMLAVPALRILVWSSAFSYMGYVRNIWILAEEKHKFLFWINASGAVASLLFNICLIPQWGVLGAALATVFTQVFTNFIMGFVLKEVRPNNALLLAGFNPRLILEMIPMLKKR